VVCGDDGCLWAKQPNLANANWIINRGDGNVTYNLVIFAFIDPNTLISGNIPAGMTQASVDFFKSKGINVMFSIGGEVYSSNWDTALRKNAAGLGKNAAMIAQKFGVGIEIDYESGGSESLLTTFAQAYRSVIPFDGSADPKPESLLTVDLAAGTGYLTSVSQWAAGQLGSTLNWAYAMVSSGPWSTISAASQYWQQHLDGSSWNNMPPMKPNYLVVSLYSSSGSPNCKSYSGTVLEGAVGWVKGKGSRGISFWAVGCPAGPASCVQDCSGIQQGSKAFLGGGGTSGSSDTGTSSGTSSTGTGTSGTSSTSSSTGGTSGGSCAGKATGMYCTDSTHFEWCPQGTVQACAPGTQCQQSGNSISCG